MRARPDSIDRAVGLGQRVTEVWFLKRRIKVMDLRNSMMTTKTVEVGVIMSLSQ